MKTTKFFKLSKSAKRAIISGSVISKQMWVDADWSYQNRVALEAQAAAEHKEWKNAQKTQREEAKKNNMKKNAVKAKRQDNRAKAAAR